MMPIPARWWQCLFVLCLAPPLHAAEPAAPELEKRVRALFETHCQRCHSHQAGKNKGGLLVDSRAALVKGGESGPALVPGHPDKSLLFRAVSYEDENLRMPPKGKLAADEIALVRAWLAAGAPWTETAPKQALRVPGQITDDDRRYWAFQPVRAGSLPDVQDPLWREHPIDRFIRARLEREGLTPAAPAERRVLARRLYFDLIGLPPPPGELDDFVADTAPDAYTKLVERLLASSHYGEHWARHWLDVVRFAESDGFRLDSYRPTAWRYRDYVVRAFNADKPFDQFVREQLAGDELAPGDPDALAATGFLCHGIYEYNQRNVRSQWNDMLNDVTDLTGEVFLGLGMGCARCHDHKFDPILQKDYFALRAFFEGMLPSEEVVCATAGQQVEHARRLEGWRKKTAKIQEQIEALEAPERRLVEGQMVAKFPADIQAMLRKPYAERAPLERQLAALAYRQVQYEFDRIDAKMKGEAKARLLELRKELTKLGADRPEPLPTCLAVREVGAQAAPTMIPKKTNVPAVAPAFLTVLGAETPTIAVPPGAASTGRRSALAHWLTRPDHPLTARVIVNRVWQSHFGRGLVANANDFGRLGEPPTHPELLDWLTRHFVADGWSLKKLHRLIVTSRAYQQTAVSSQQSARQTKDPENRLLSRGEVRRLDAEQIRDAVLALTGKLDRTPGGPSVELAQPRRSIYLKVQRNTKEPLLEVFDLPEAFVSVGRRNVTTTPTQSLLMLNSPLMLDYSRAFATRLERDAGTDSSTRIDLAFRLAFGRAPTSAERQSALAFLSEQARRIRPADQRAAVEEEVGRLPFREGRAAVLTPGGAQSHFEASDDARLHGERFTVEAYVLLRSVFDDATVRTIASHWDGNTKGAGWVFGVTGKKSAYKSQMLVLQMWGQDGAGKPAYEALFSGLHLQLNKPYYVAVAVDLRDRGETGVTFYTKDLSNDEEPAQRYPIAHTVTTMTGPRGPFLIGGTLGKAERPWDGLIDDVRLSREALGRKHLLLEAPTAITADTVGYWQFEANAGMLHDSSPSALHLHRRGTAPAEAAVAPERAALIDFCQVLLNANEFLYVD
jgi:mono/diheme cytochrome c family protein